MRTGGKLINEKRLHDAGSDIVGLGDLELGFRGRRFGGVESTSREDFTSCALDPALESTFSTGSPPIGLASTRGKRDNAREGGLSGGKERGNDGIGRVL